MNLILKFTLLIMLFLLTACGGGSEEESQINPPTEPGPTILSMTLPANATYADGGGQLLFQVNYSEIVNVQGTPGIALNIGGSTRFADYVSGSGTASLEFGYSVQAGDNDLDGIAFEQLSIDFNGGSIKSVSNIIAQRNFGGLAGSLSGVLVNTSSGITPPNQVTGVTTAPTTVNTNLNVSWNVPSDNGSSIINYSVQYRELGQSVWNSINPPTSNSATISGLLEGTTYEIRVAANNGLLGSYSPISTAEIFDIMSLDPIAWLSATNITNGGTEPSNGDLISEWADLTGAATNAIETNTANQPTYETNVQNGLPAVRFNNLDRGLEGTFVRANNGGLTIFLVGKFNGTARRAFFEFYQQGSPTSGASSRRGFFFTYGFGTASTNYNLDNTQFNVWTAYDTGFQSSLWENGVNLYTDINNHFGRTDFLGNGVYVLGDDQTGGDRLDGYICEFLVFDRALTAGETSQIETYLNNKWGAY